MGRTVIRHYIFNLKACFGNFIKLLGIPFQIYKNYIHVLLFTFVCLLQVRCFKVVGSLLSKENAGMSKHNQNILFHTNAVIPLKASRQARTRLVTTLDLCHSGINTRPLPRYPRNLSVTLQLTQPPPTLYS